MRIAVLSDIHSNTENLQRIRKILIHNKVELVLLLGDLTNYGPVETAEEILQQLQFAPLLAIPGNLDIPAVQQLLEERNVSLHKKKKRINGWTFVGYGGGLVGHGGEIKSSEAEIGKTLNELMQGQSNVMLATHVPPYNTKLDLAHSGVHVGSKAVRRIIEKEQPGLHLCGHIHEAAGEEKIGNTVSINIGAVKEGKALLLKLDKKIEFQRIEV